MLHVFKGGNRVVIMLTWVSGRRLWFTLLSPILHLILLFLGEGKDEFLVKDSTEDNRSLLLDDDCLIKRNYDCFLIGLVKEICSLTNLRVTCNNEGFDGV